MKMSELSISKKVTKIPHDPRAVFAYLPEREREKPKEKEKKNYWGETFDHRISGRRLRDSEGGRGQGKRKKSYRMNFLTQSLEEIGKNQNFLKRLEEKQKGSKDFRGMRKTRVGVGASEKLTRGKSRE